MICHHLCETFSACELNNSLDQVAVPRKLGQSTRARPKWLEDVEASNFLSGAHFAQLLLDHRAGPRGRRGFRILAVAQGILQRVLD